MTTMIHLIQYFQNVIISLTVTLVTNILFFLWDSLKWDTLWLTAYLSHKASHTWLAASSLASAAKHLLNKTWVNASLEHRRPKQPS